VQIKEARRVSDPGPIREGVLLTGALFSEPMRVERVYLASPDAWQLGLVGLQSDRFRRVTLSQRDIASLVVRETVPTFSGDGRLLRVGLQAEALGIAYEFDPYFGVSMSRVDPLPHQLEAVYDYLLKLPRVRFLLADDAGAGKTIMAGLLVRELKLRGLADRVLVVCPANLAFQWQRELLEKFGEKFVVMKGADIREQFGFNQWQEQPHVITSLDLAKRDDILPGIRQVRWNLVIVDEAHRMSWTPPAKKTERYALGEMLRDVSDNILMLTATPHKGDPENFTRFLQLLDRDVFADVKSIQDAMERRRAPFYLRRTKEAMVYFPEPQGDGTWAARRIFTKRIAETVDFRIDGDEFALYRAVTAFVKRQSACAAESDNPRARAVGFLMALYQRRLASSTHSLLRSLENRAERLDQGLRKAEDAAREAPPDIPTPEEFEEMEDADRERLEKTLEAMTLTRNADQVRVEIAELRRFAEEAKRVEDAGVEAKLAKLKSLLHEKGFFDQPKQRLLLFTEFKDTLTYLVRLLREWGFTVGFIHGGMKPGSREEPGSRLYAEQQFRDGDIQILVATEAAGEGINLQCCHILFNYDIPWNPNRLEQRMGRIHRYGQTHDCLIFNFVATNTIEGRVLQTLLDKLQEIRDALDDDAVFNVVGEVLPAARVEQVLRDYYAGRLGDTDLEERLLRDVDKDHFQAICQNALEGLASKKLNLAMLTERRARAQERRVVPETIARFIKESADVCGFPVKVVSSLPHAFEPGRTPTDLRFHERSPDWKLPALATRYPRCSTDRDTADRHALEWVTPGHPLFEALRRQSVRLAHDAFATGACFYSLANDAPMRVDVYRAKVVDGLAQDVHERLFVVEIADGVEPQLRDPALLGDLTPAPAPDVLPPVALVPEVTAWLHDHAFRPFLDEVRAERESEVDRIFEHIHISLKELLEKADEEIGRAADEVEQGVQGAEGRVAQATSRHDELRDRLARRTAELAQQRSLTLQGVERITSILVLPSPERETPELRRLRPDPVVEAIAMREAEAYEVAEGRVVTDVHEKNLGYDLTSLDPKSGELRLIEVKGIGGAMGDVLLTPNERRVAEDRRDCYWLYVVTECKTSPRLEPVRDPARLAWHQVLKVQHYRLQVNAIEQPTTIREREEPYGENE